MQTNDSNEQPSTAPGFGFGDLLGTTNMKYVKQKDPNGCGIACVAMMSDSESVTYDLVKNVWLKSCNGLAERIERNTIGGGLRYTELLDIAHLLGIRLTPHIAPTIVQITKNSGGHYVVIDKDGKIHDPSA